MKSKLTDSSGRSFWRLEGDSLISPSGARVAKIRDGMLWLYDKRTRTSWPITVEELARLISSAGPPERGARRLASGEGSTL